MTHFFEVSLESALLTWALVFFLLFSPDTFTCQFLLWNLGFSVHQELWANPGQQGTEIQL